MSSSQLGTDPFLSSDSSTPGRVHLQLEKIGHGQQFFKWTPEVHDDFTNWWLTTDWCLENLDKGETAAAIHWESKARTSNSWQHFYQAAHSRTGHPYLICQQCSAVLEHPRTKNSGTKALSTHISSQKCRKHSSTSSKAYKQTRIYDTPITKVGRLLY
jgi:hypothetical protein